MRETVAEQPTFTDSLSGLSDGVGVIDEGDGTTNSGDGADERRTRSSGSKREERASPSTARIEGARTTFDLRAITDEVGLGAGSCCDETLRAVVEHATAGDGILFRDGTFRLDELHIVRKPLVIEGRNAVLAFGDSGGIHFRGSHYNGADPETTTVLVEPAPKGRADLAVESTDGFRTGAYVLIETGYSGWSSHHPLRAGSGYSCQIARIEDCTASRFHLERPVRTRFEPAFDGGAHGVEIHRLDPLETPVFRGLKTVGGEISSGWSRVSAVVSRAVSRAVTGTTGFG